MTDWKTTPLKCAACGAVIGDKDLFYLISKGDWEKHKEQFTAMHPYHFVVRGFIQ